MTILLGDGLGQELEIAGTAVEWEAFGAAILRHGIEIPCDVVADPAPYAQALSRLTIEHAAGQAVEFRLLKSDELRLVGDPLGLTKLAATAQNLSRDFASGSHIHVEYQGPSHFIGHNSIPAVFFRL